MKEQKQIATDEQIVSFLSGTATEGERETVLKYVSESDENYNYFMSIAEAVQVHRNEREATKESESTEAQKRHILPLRKPKPIVWRAAAAVAVVLVSGGLILVLSGRGGGFADNNELAMNTEMVSSQAYGDAVALNSSQSMNSNDPILFAEADSHTEIEDIYGTMPGGIVGSSWATGSTGGGKDNEVHLAASQSAADIPQTTDPLKTRYDLIATVPKEWRKADALSVSWKCNADNIFANKVIFELKPQGSTYGRWDTIFSDVLQEGKAIVPGSVQRDLILRTDTLDWKITAVFEDGKTEKRGTIVVVE